MRPKKSVQICCFCLTETIHFHHQKFARFSKGIFCWGFKGCRNPKNGIRDSLRFVQKQEQLLISRSMVSRSHFKLSPHSTPLHLSSSIFISSFFAPDHLKFAPHIMQHSISSFFSPDHLKFAPHILQHSNATHRSGVSAITILAPQQPARPDMCPPHFRPSPK